MGTKLSEEVLYPEDFGDEAPVGLIEVSGVI